MFGSKNRGRVLALLPTIIFDAAAISVGVPLGSACSSGSTAPNATPASDQCAVQPDASIISNGPSFVYVPLVGPASACPTDDAGLLGVPPVLSPGRWTNVSPPDPGGRICSRRTIDGVLGIVITQDGGNEAPGIYGE